MGITFYFDDNSFNYDLDVPDSVKYEILAKYYGVTVEQLKKIDDDFDLFADDRFAELFEDELRDYYNDEAYEMYKDCVEYNKDPMSYYGLKQSDFI